MRVNYIHLKSFQYTLYLQGFHYTALCEPNVRACTILDLLTLTSMFVD